MLWRDVVDLILITNGENEIGDVVETETKKQVFANKKSIRQSEFYQAMVTGLKPELMFEVRYEDYNEEQKLKHENKTYQITRTHSKNGEIIELVCQGLSTNG
ncbi:MULTISPECIES: phage head closure protein [Bacillaceae]|uniref:Phage head closure protein n=1 Tax=Evansella alkalicola TaxID=745819 RepID=A0ABS6JZV0_9BACI|nr:MULTISPECIES: phage head closure protein [Bacillaceae]MBU9724127.1 phage head closure protein [Bacillus alkalicola]